MAAQSWLEWRVHGWLALFALGMGLMWLVPMMFMIRRTLDNEVVYQLVPWLAGLVEAPGKGGVIALLPLIIPLLVVAMGGGGLAGFKNGNRQIMPAFFLTRPLDNGRIIAAKFRFAAELMAVVWGAAALIAVAWVGAEGLLADTAARLEASFGPGWWLQLAAAIVSAYAMSWLWVASGLWAGFRGSGVAAMVGVAATLALPGALYHHINWLVALAAAVNAGAPLWILRGNRLLMAACAGAAGVVAALLGLPWVTLLLWPIPGLLAARPALDRARAR
jgi:hypothetical protein